MSREAVEGDFTLRLHRLGNVTRRRQSRKGRMWIRVSDLNTTDILGWIILCWGQWAAGTVVHCQKLNSIPGLYTLDAGSTLIPIMTTKGVSRHHQVSQEAGAGRGMLQN